MGTSLYHTSLTADCPGAQQNLGNSAWNIVSGRVFVLVTELQSPFHQGLYCRHSECDDLKEMLLLLAASAQMRMGSLGQEDPLEKGMATPSCILAWRIPWTEGAWQATVHRVTKSWTQLK